MSLAFHIGDDGTPRALASPPLALLAGVLESEVQGSVVVGRRFLRALSSVLDGRLARWEETGNAYTVTMSPDSVSIVLEEFPGGTLHVSPARFTRAMTAWIDFLDRVL